MHYKLKLNELEKLAKEIDAKMKSGVIILRGDLASGKTSFVKAMVKYLGINEDVTSPTFSLQQCYGDKIYHYDMYNHGLQHFMSLGMLEELDKDGLHLIEWGDDELLDILHSAGMNVVNIQITKNTNDTRQYEVDYAYA